MTKIIRFRPLCEEWKNLNYAKVIKPFEDRGLVENFYETNLPELCELLCDVMTDHNNHHYKFDHLLRETRLNESPSTLFEALKEKSERLPDLWAYTEGVNGRKKNIYAITDPKMLQSLAYALGKESVGV